jgi:hypothetical protein
MTKVHIHIHTKDGIMQDVVDLRRKIGALIGEAERIYAELNSSKIPQAADRIRGAVKGLRDAERALVN